ncbi:putative mitochondrial protein [Tanacetum coccineum]
MIFGDDETIATLLINMSKAKATTKEKEKGLFLELKETKEKKKMKSMVESVSEDDVIPQAGRQNSTEKLQEQEREQFTIGRKKKSYSSFMYNCLLKKVFLLNQRYQEAIETDLHKNQFKNLDDDFLKHVKRKNRKDFLQRRKDQGLAGEGGKGADRGGTRGAGEEGEESKEEVKKEENEEGTRKRKLGTRKKMKSRKRRYIQNTSEDDSDKENDELRKTECLGTKNHSLMNPKKKRFNLNVREDLNAVFQMVMDKYQDEMPEGFERVLWGDLKVLFNPDEQDEFWSSQHAWKVISWKLHSSSGVHTLMTEEGLVIHMLIEKKYPLKKEIVMKSIYPEQTCSGKGTSKSCAEQRVEYLGHIISKEGVLTDPSKIQAMEQWPTPQTVKQLRGFLGLTGYYRKFIKNYAWIKTDASGVGIRAVLKQEGHPIAYLSKTLAPKHQALSTYEKEFLAVLMALEKWRSYLLDRHFKIKTDHFSLKYLLNQRVTTPF